MHTFSGCRYYHGTDPAPSPRFGPLLQRLLPLSVRCCRPHTNLNASLTPPNGSLNLDAATSLALALPTRKCGMLSGHHFSLATDTPIRLSAFCVAKNSLVLRRRHPVKSKNSFLSSSLAGLNWSLQQPSPSCIRQKLLALLNAHAHPCSLPPNLSFSSCSLLRLLHAHIPSSHHAGQTVAKRYAGNLIDAVILTF